MMVHNNLVGGWSTYPSEKYDFVKWDDDIPKIWENKKCSKPPTSHHMDNITMCKCLFKQIVKCWHVEKTWRTYYLDLVKGSRQKKQYIFTIDSPNGGYSIGKIKSHRKQTQDYVNVKNKKHM